MIQIMEMRPKNPMILVAAVLVSLLGAVAFNSLPYFGILFMAIAVLSILVLMGVVVRNSVERRRSDPYDLQLLRDIHEQEEFERADAEHIEESDTICPHCGHLYGPKFRICPACKRSP